MPRATRPIIQKLYEFDLERKQLRRTARDGRQNQDAKPAGRRRLLRQEVGPEEIAEVVSAWTGIPVSRMVETERAKLLVLEDRIHQRMVDQDEAVEAVANAVRRNRSGLQDPSRPIGSFIFLGPTGVGKTEFCKALAEVMFDDENAMIRLDMSEFMERHTVSRLIGAPPGYVGYEEGGMLTEAVRRRPYSVILLDEIEKAHRDVFNVLLQVLDDGRLSDNQGHTVDFTNTIIVMTRTSAASSSRRSPRRAARSRGAIREAVHETLQTRFLPEFLNRVDEILIFHPLTRPQLRRQSVDLQIKRLEKQLLPGAGDQARTCPTRPWRPSPRRATTRRSGPGALKRVIPAADPEPLGREDILKREFAAGSRVRGSTTWTASSLSTASKRPPRRGRGPTAMASISSICGGASRYGADPLPLGEG